MSSDLIKPVSDATFEAEVLNAERPVLVLFSAVSSALSTTIAPLLDDVASEHQGDLTVAQLNIDGNPATAPKYGIRDIPTLLLFKNGEVAATKVRPLGKSELRAFLDAHL